MPQVYRYRRGAGRQVGRNSTHEAVILRSRRFAEYHKQLTLLTADVGVIDAIAYGACKSRSKMAGATESFTGVVAYVYTDPVKQRCKINDVVVKDANDGIRNDMKRFYIASLISELVQKTYAGGDEFERLYPLVSEGYRLLQKANDDMSDLIMIQILMRFFLAIGYPPNWSECERCGIVIDRGSSHGISRDGSTTCTGCAGSNSVVIPPGGMAYLHHTVPGSLSASLRVGLESNAVDGLKRGLLLFAERVAESSLRSLQGADQFLFGGNT